MLVVTVVNPLFRHNIQYLVALSPLYDQQNFCAPPSWIINPNFEPQPEAGAIWALENYT